jgi:plastocyanin
MRRLPLLLALVPLAAGCGGSSGTATPPPKPTTTAAGPVIRTIAISEREFRLSPASITVTQPGTYVLRGINRGTTAHGLALLGNGVDVASLAAQPGKTTTLRVTIGTPGRYELYCPVDSHADQGMRGTLTLTGGGGATPRPSTTASTPP